MKLRRLLSAVTALLLVCSLPVSVLAAEYDLAKGSITVTATADGQTVTHGDNDAVQDDAPVIIQTNIETATTNTITIKAEENTTANVTIQDVNIVISDPSGSPQDHSGQAAVTIDVAENAEANVTLDGVNINTKNTGGEFFDLEIGDLVAKHGEAAVQITGNGDVTLELDGENTVQSGYRRAGVEKNDADSSGKLTITDETGTSGSLEATGGELGSGIGGGDYGSGSNITITGNAEVTATGGANGAGIGGGNYGSGSEIIISGSAEVTATGGDRGAGIGSGAGGSGTNITIEGSAEVTATGGDQGAGIGSGAGGGIGSYITITDSAEVTATGGDQGAGIGGGKKGSGSDITISGSAKVNANGGDEGAGIGGGFEGSGNDITIEGSAEVTATGGDYGSGIGGGSRGSGSDITITGSAEVTAQGGFSGSGIGGGSGGSGSAITIEGSTEVTATGGVEGSGIGGGSGGSGSSITITGSAEVTAKGGDSGSGIGGGSNGNGNGTGSNITVSGDAQVKAQGGNQYTAFGQNYFGAGAAIGNGGELRYGAVSNPGDDVAPNTEGLNEGWIAKYAPGADMDSATPNSVTYKGETGVTTSENVTLVPEKAPTCIEEGHTAGFQCGNDQVGVETRQTVDHSYGGYVSNNDATCTSDGTKSRACIWCNAEDPISISDPGTMLRHEMGESYTVTAATCQAEGVERANCKNCDYYETRPLKKVDHSYGDFSSDNNATCTSDGTKTRKCIWCDLPDTVTDPGTMKEHSFTNYISDNNATYTSDGTKTAKCDACDATHTIPDPGTRLPFYKVKGQDGAQLRCEEQKQDGVLTIEVDADCASLTGSFSGMKALKARGVDTIVFVTKGATSTFAVEDLLAQGASGDTYSLTHDGEKVTFTLGNGSDIGKILK